EDRRPRAAVRRRRSPRTRTRPEPRRRRDPGTGGGVTTTDELGFNDPTAQRLERIATGAAPEIVGPMLADILHDPRWLESDVALISGGKSNLTYRVAC